MSLRTVAWKAISSLARSISMAIPFWTQVVSESRMAVAEEALGGAEESWDWAVDLQSSRRVEADLLAIVLESVCSTSMPSLIMTTVMPLSRDSRGLLMTTRESPLWSWWSDLE